MYYRKIQKQLDMPVIYSDTREIPQRMIQDLKRYVKFYAVEPDMHEQIGHFYT